jgi:ribosomal protein S27E
MNLNVSSYAIAEVEKMLHCRDPKYGFLTYKCPDCGASRIVPMACKSRICPQCGKKYADHWADELAGTLFAVSHRHIVFTIPEELRKVLDEDHSLLKVLMDAVSNTMHQMIKGRHGAVPGIVCVLHPYGKDMKLNPHVHVLVTEGGLNRKGEWVPVSFLEYGALRRIWQYQLLTMVKRELPKTWENSRLIDSLFKGHKDGFYVYAKRRVSKPKNIAKYIGRYLRHPAIAESRISEFNVESNMVTFWYEEHGEKKFVTLPALEFIDRLVKLIPDKNLKLIRYYGLYSRRAQGKLQKMLTPLSRERVVVARRKEEIKCPRCGQTMDLVAASRPVDEQDEEIEDDFG